MGMTDFSTITVATRPAVVGPCGLCAQSAGPLTALVAVTHGGGTVAQFEACELCERALRRLEAVTPGYARFAVGVAVSDPAPVVPALVEEVGPAVPILELTQPIQDGDGALYVPVVTGAQRGDGTWAGWIEFREIGGTRILRTNRETTQPNRGAVEYWATGLQPAYLQGAFQRARRPHMVDLT